MEDFPEAKEFGEEQAEEARQKKKRSRVQEQWADVGGQKKAQSAKKKKLTNLTGRTEKEKKKAHAVAFAISGGNETIDAGSKKDLSGG